MPKSSLQPADHGSASSAGTEPSSASTQPSRAARAARELPGWIRGALALTALLLLAALMTETAPVRLTSVPSERPASASVLAPTPSLAPLPGAAPTAPPTPSSTPAPSARQTPLPVPGDTPTAVQTSAPTDAQTPRPGSTPTPTPRITSTSTAPMAATRTSAPALTLSPPATPTGTAGEGQTEYVPAAFERTSLGQAVIDYNATHPQKMTLHVVGSDSQGVDRAMYQDLVARQWRIMGPEDFPQSAEKSGWPYLVIALQDTLDANSVAGWGYVLEHEWVHMVAAANLATAGLNLAELMRSPDGRFSHQARFHEVCADFYPRDPNGEHRPVAAFYGALQRMPELLRVLSGFEPPALAYQPAAEYQVLAITGLPLVDAACVWDRAAMQAVRRLYDERQGAGAFELLFPGY